MRSAPSVITESGFGSEAAIRRGDHHHRGSRFGVGEWAHGRMQRGEGGAGAETGEVRTVDLEMRLGLE